MRLVRALAVALLSLGLGAGAARADLATFGFQYVLPHGVANSFVQSTDLVTDLRNFVGATVPASAGQDTGTEVYARGLASVGDGFGGMFYWNSKSTAADDGATVIQPTAVTGPGRWLKVIGLVPTAPPGTNTQQVATTAFVLANAGSPVSATPIDHSGRVAVGGAAQTLMAPNANRLGCLIQNNSSGDLWLNDLTTASPATPSIWLPSGAAYQCDPAPPGAISVYGAVTGQPYTAREW
jgi:hypothetical protein